MSRSASGEGRDRRLRGSDSGFLYVESGSQTSTCVDVVVLAPPAGGRSPLTRDELEAHVGARLGRLRHLQRRLHLVPGGVGHPVWADDPEFDLGTHISHATLGAAHLAAGTPDEQLHAWLPEVSATRMPLDRPLWHVTLVDGFSDGSQALVFQVHHTLGDGVALIGLLGELCDDRRAAEPPLLATGDQRRQPAPWAPWLLLSTLVRQFLVWLRVPWLLARTVRAVRVVRARREQADAPVPRMAGSAPDTVLNRSADTRRVFARAVMDLADLKKVKAATGVPLSDVVVTVVAGALRSHLAARDALPEIPLVVNVPVGNDRPASRRRVRGNVFANFYAFLPTDVADPRERLAAVGRHHAEARHQLELQGDLITSWLDLVPPAIAWRAAQKMAVKHRDGESVPDYNVLVSNMRVPERDWVMRGRPVRTVFMSGPVTDGFGLNITVTGFGDEVTFTLHANPASVPDPVLLAQQLRDSLTELVRAHDVPARDLPGDDRAAHDTTAEESEVA